MKILINVEESIRNERLKITGKNEFKELLKLGDVIGLTCQVAFGIVLVYFLIKNFGVIDIVSNLEIFLLIPFIIIPIISVYVVVNHNKLKRFHGIDSELNRRIMNEIISDWIEVQEKLSADKFFILYNKPGGFFAISTRVTVILDESDILINISRFNSLGDKSLYHHFLDIFRIRSIIKEFNRRSATPIE